MKRTLLSATLLIGVFAGCKKDKAPSLYEERRKIILEGSWNLVYRGEDLNKDGIYDIANVEENFLAECQMDDTYNFKADGKYTIAPNAHTNGCTSDTIHGNWQLNADGAALVMDTYPGAIDSLTADYLRYRLDIAEYSTYFILTK